MKSEKEILKELLTSLKEREEILKQEQIETNETVKDLDLSNYNAGVVGALSEITLFIVHIQQKIINSLDKEHTQK